MKVSKMWIYEACSLFSVFSGGDAKGAAGENKIEGDDIPPQVYREIEFEF